MDSTSSLRTRSARSAGALVIGALACLGALATTLSVRQEQQSVRLVDQRAADLASSQIRGALASTVASLRGADAMAVDGRISSDEFEVFTTGVLNNSLFEAIAFAEVVTEAERSEFEQRTGLTIQDTDGKGGFTPALVRPRAIVVSMLAPTTDGNRAVLGFDIASDPVRLAAALESERVGLPTMSSRITTATRAATGVAVLIAVRDPDGVTIGCLTSGLEINDAIERAGVDVGSFEHFGLQMDGRPLIGDDRGEASQFFDVAGHRFTVTLSTDNRVDLLVPLLIAVSTLVLLITVVVAARRDSRQRERIALSARRARAINELGQALAAATDANRVIDAVLDRGASIMEANHTIVALRRTDDATRLTLTHDRSSPVEFVPHRVRVDDRRPYSHCVHTGSEVVLPDLATLAAQFPEALAEARATDIEVAIWVPLVFGRDVCIGALGVTWATTMSADDLEECRVAAHTVAELTSRSMERAVTSMTVQAAADSLGQLARRLAGAHDQLDVQAAVSTHAARVLGARSAELLLGSAIAVDGTAIVERAIKDRSGSTIGHLVLDWPRALVLGSAQSAVFDTMVEMIGQTLERAALTEQEHQVIVQLQRDLLPAPPTIDGIDVAVHYQPAMSVVGLGGDFYDVLSSGDDRVFVVIGDVTGHGSEAVAAMAELKAVIQNLLRGGAGLDAVCDEADLLLHRRGMYATAAIAEIDARRQTVRLVNAGHPYPILRRHNGSAELLTDGHRPLLGLGPDSRWSTTRPPNDAAPSATHHLAAGDALLLYTDGVIERRTESIDVGMQRLVQSIESAELVGGTATDDDSAAALLARVVGRSSALGNGDKTDDDMALLVVRRPT